MNPLVDFSQALSALKQGKRVRRAIWPTHHFVFRQVPARIEADVIPRMQSLPESVKNEFAARGGPIFYDNQFAHVGGINQISGWAPSPQAALAEDWIILD